MSSTPTIEVVYVQGNPYPYVLFKREVTTLSGHKVNACSLNRGEQYMVYIAPEEIVRRERIPVESWM